MRILVKNLCKFPEADQCDQWIKLNYRKFILTALDIYNFNGNIF